VDKRRRIGKAGLLMFCWALSLAAMSLSLAGSGRFSFWMRVFVPVMLIFGYLFLWQIPRVLMRWQLWAAAVLFAAAVTLGASFEHAGSVQLLAEHKGKALIYFLGRVPAFMMGMALFWEAAKRGKTLTRGLPAVTAYASTPDTDLAQIMAGGEAVLEEVPFLSPSDTYTIRIPATKADTVTLLNGTAEPTYTDDGKWLTVTVNGSALPLEAGYSSPDGSKMLCPDGANLWLFEGDTLTLLSPDTARSVEDTYGSFEHFLQSDTRQWVGAEGVTWSQDGHYAVLTNYKSVIQMVRMIYGLYVIDTQTGSILCLDTFPSKFGTGAASVLQACFDETGRILYAIVFGDTKNNYGDPVSLVRYDMETGKKQKLCGSEMIVGMPRLQADAQGRLWNLITPHSSAENGGLN
jgi:hypothetical protein